MHAKRIIVVGGGLSGLSVLHHLKKRYQDSSIDVVLLEKNSYLGGTAHTQYYPEYSFEEGPNGFLDNKESLRQTAVELGLEHELVVADEQSKYRFLSIKNKLAEIPITPAGLIKFPHLSPGDKTRLLLEIMIPRGQLKDETVYAFAMRRLGRNFAKYFIDPMVTGIFGGQADRLVLRYAFPRIYELEQTHGSLFKAMAALRRQNKSQDKMTGQPKGALTSFKKGISQFIEAFSDRYKGSIRTSVSVSSIFRTNNRWLLQAEKEHYEADQVFLCAPAYAAAQMLKQEDAALSRSLANIPYAPIAVVGCLYVRKDLAEIPRGFGYLIPSSENKEILGVLFDSNIFPMRTHPDYFFARLMIGGSRRPDTAAKPPAELARIAQAELVSTLGIVSPPVQTVVKVWPKAIPQYDLDYIENLPAILAGMSRLHGLYLVSNYLGGISMNDCIRSAQTAVYQSKAC